MIPPETLASPSARRLRVLHLITRMIVGGAQWNTLYTLQRLNRDRYDPLFACGPQTGPEGSLLQQVKDQGIPAYVVPDLVRELSPLRDFRALGQLERLYRDLEVDIVHCHSSKAGILGRWAGHRARVPCVVHTVHGFAFNSRLSAALHTRLERKAADWCDALIFISRPLMETAESLNIGNAQEFLHIPSGIDVESFQRGAALRRRKRGELGVADGILIIGTVGRLVEDKGHRELLHAAEVLAQKGLEFRMVWVGDGPLRDSLEELAKNLNLSDRLQITGVRQDVPDWLGCFDVFALPTLWEGMGRVFLEAQAAGVPVVATRVGGVPEVVADGISGLLVPPGDVPALADVLERLLLDETLRQQMGNAGRESVGRTYTIEHMVREIEKVYERTWQKRRDSSSMAANGSYNER